MKDSLKKWCLENQQYDFLKEYSTDNIYDIDKITIGSSKKVIWKGKCGHIWESTISHRIGGRGCPYCAHKKVIKGVNDLMTMNPKIANEWNYNKNEESPDTVFNTSNKKVWWICPKGHEYQAKISNRTALGRGCPTCNKERHTSFPEQIIYYYVRDVFPDAINNYKDKITKKEIDIYIPKLKIGIEYDGYYFHKNKIIKDTEKDDYFSSLGIKIIRIKEVETIDEVNTNKNEENIIYVCCKSNFFIAMKKVLIELAMKLNIKDIWDNVDIHNDSTDIIINMYTKEKSNSLSMLYPKLLESWNWEKNRGLNPEFIPAVSGKKVWWKCPKCNHEWQARISHRTKRNHGCPQCSKQLPYSKEEEEIIRKYYPLEGISVVKRLPNYRTKRGVKSKVSRMNIKRRLKEC